MTDWPHQRLLPPDPETYNARQKEVAEAIISGPRGRLVGPLAVWLNNPDLAEGAQSLGRYLRYGTSLGPRLSELAIITTARLWSAEFEWYAHKPLALQAGVSEAVVEAIRTNTPPPFDDEEDFAVHEFSAQAAGQRQVSDALYAKTLAVLGQERLLDLVGLIGYYGLVSLTLNTFRILPPADAGQELT